MAEAKIFRIQLVGTREVERNAQAARKAFKDMVADIAAAKKEMAELLKAGGDAATITALKNKITDLQKAQRLLNQERVIAEKTAKAQADAEIKLAKAKLLESQTRKTDAQTTAVQNKDQITQEKELDRQIALDERRARAKERENRFVNALAGSYNQLYGEYKKQRDILAAMPIDKTNKAYLEQEARVKSVRDKVDSFNRSLTKDGLLVGEYASGIIKAFKSLGIDDIIRDQVAGSKKELESLKQKTSELVVAYRKAQQEGSADLNKLEKEIHDNVAETQRLGQAIQATEAQLSGMGGIGTQIVNGLKENFKNLKKDIAQFAIGFFGFQAAFNAIQGGIKNASVISDQTTDLEINLGKAAGGADKLVESLGKLNTRTTVQQLEVIADTALKAGTTEENLLGVAEAIDKTKIAFGKDFGSVEQGTETFAKLINIFFDDGEITGDRILSIGNGIRTLANETVASVPFINDFAGRMAGLKQITKITLPDVIGLGAGFEEFKQSAEVAATALTTVIPKLATDVEKFALVSGLTVEQFKQLLNNNPVEALLKVSEGLVKGRGDIQGVAEAFADAGLDAGRVVTILGTLGGKADVFRQRIALAGTAMQNTTAITDAFEKKNNNLAATLDKIDKKFKDVAANKSFQTVILVLATGVTFLLGNLPIVIGLLALYGLGWLTVTKEIATANGVITVSNGQLLLQRVALIGNNIVLGLVRIYTALATVATAAYSAALGLLTGALSRTTAALTLAGTAMRLLPIGLILTLIALLVASFRAFGGALNGTTHQLKESALRMQALAEINRKARDTIAEQITVIDSWIAVLKSASASADTKRAALQKLIEINPAFRSALQGQAVDLQKLNQAYAQVTNAIRIKAQAEAAASLSAEKQKKVLEISGFRQEIEIEAARNKTGLFNVEVSDQMAALLRNSELFNSGALVTIVNGQAQFMKGRFDEIKKFLNQKEQEAIGVYNAYLNAQTQKQAELSRLEEEANKQQQTLIDKAAKEVEVDIPFLKSKIEQLDKQIAAFRGARADLLKLKAERDKFQKQLDDLTKDQKQKPAGASKLTGAQKDDFKEIEAARDRLIAQLERARLEQTKFNGVLINTENVYLTELLRINNTAIDKKLKLLKGKNEEEKKIIAELNLEKIKNQRETNQKLFALENQALEFTLANRTRTAQNRFELSGENPELSNVQRLQLREELFSQLLAEQIAFNNDQIALEKKYGVVSIENEQKRKEAIEKLLAELRGIRRSTTNAEIQDIRDAAARQINEYTINFSKIRQTILDNDKLTNRQKKRQLEELDKAERRTILSAELAALNIEVEALKKKLKEGLASRDQYLERVKEQNKKAEELSKATLNKPLDDFDNTFRGFVDTISELFKTGDLFSKEIGQSGISIGNVIAQSFDIAKTAMNGYFDAQRQRIEEERDMKLEQLDRDKARVLALARTKSEEEIIERQFDAKKRQIEKDAAERLKKSRRAEAKIAFAAELANIAVAAAANPANAATFGVAGIIQFAVLSALAAVRFGLRMKEINSATFERGGALRRKLATGADVTTRGGVFSGPRHHYGGIPFDYEAEDQEAFVINRTSTAFNRPITARGTARQILSAINEMGGGVSFAPGGRIKYQGGGTLGTNLQAPVFNNGFNSSVVNASGDTSRIDRLEVITEAVLEAVYASDKKPVELNPNQVTHAQEKTKKNVSLATI